MAAESTVEEEEKILSGYLHKQGDGLLKFWRKRWFRELPDEDIITYHTSNRDVLNPLGVISLSLCLDARIIDESGENGFLFDIYSPDRIIHLSAESKEELHHWVNALNQRIRNSRGKRLSVRMNLSPEVPRESQRSFQEFGTFVVASPLASKKRSSKDTPKRNIDTEKRIQFREPEAWEKNLVALEKGEWGEEMEDAVFRRYKQKNYRHISQLAEELDSAAMEKRIERKSRAFGHSPKRLTTAQTRNQILQEQMRKSEEEYERLEDEAAEKEMKAEKEKGKEKELKVTVTPTLAVPKPKPNTPQRLPSIGDLPPLREDQLSRPSSKETLELNYAILEHEMNTLKRRHFHLLCVMVKSTRFTRDGEVCNVSAANLMEEAMKMPVEEWEGFIQKKFDESRPKETRINENPRRGRVGSRGRPLADSAPNLRK